ncbi:calcium-binding protein 5 [Podarcis lilfordi]|uniref:Calcium-binding protein 5 n=1 Tax=Podarcis lilfordi TaxID=74358 RepID=A0AA35L6C0_9SAUR|nr:calcium-binding protein 5 [Podarcis lilfordi]
MQNTLGPACIFLRKGIAEKQGERELGADEIEELREAFDEFDKDKDGYISCKDLGNLMRTMGYMPTEMELIELSQQINMNLGGRVDFEDFVEMMTPKLLAETAGMIGLQEMRDAFKEFDTNGDGEITLDELYQAMQRLMGERLTSREIADVVKEADVNGDGTVDFEGTRYHNVTGPSTTIYLPLDKHNSPVRVCEDDVTLMESPSPLWFQRICECMEFNIKSQCELGGEKGSIWGRNKQIKEEAGILLRRKARGFQKRDFGEAGHLGLITIIIVWAGSNEGLAWHRMRQ